MGHVAPCRPLDEIWDSRARIFFNFFKTWDGGILGKKEIKMVELQQFGSLGEVKCHILNIGG